MYSILPLTRRDCDPLTEESAAGNACQIYTFKKKMSPTPQQRKAAVFRKAPSFFSFVKPKWNRQRHPELCLPHQSVFLERHSTSDSLSHTRPGSQLFFHILFILFFLISESLYECAAGCCQRKNLNAATPTPSPSTNQTPLDIWFQV